MASVDGLWVTRGLRIEKGVRGYDPQSLIEGEGVETRRKWGLLEGTRKYWQQSEEKIDESCSVVEKGSFVYCPSRDNMGLRKGRYTIWPNKVLEGEFKYYGGIDNIWLVEGKFEEGETKSWDG